MERSALRGEIESRREKRWHNREKEKGSEKEAGKIYKKRKAVSMFHCQSVGRSRRNEAKRSMRHV